MHTPGEHMTDDGLDRLAADVLDDRPMTIGEAVNRMAAGELDIDDLQRANGGSWPDNTVAMICIAAQVMRKRAI